MKVSIMALTNGLLIEKPVLRETIKGFEVRRGIGITQLQTAKL